MVGTTVGFLSYEVIGFRLTCDIFFFLQIPFLIMFVLYGGVIPAFRNLTKRKTVKVEDDIPNTER